MKHPWQVWTLFLFSLALVVPAMVWLTLKALELDRAEAEAQRQTVAARRLETEARRQAEAARRLADLARQQAELQERVSSVLWRMDWTLTPIVAQEAARPHFVYQPFYPAYQPPAGKTTRAAEDVRQVPSPLLLQPSEFVLLHFQCSPENVLTSPQNPTGTACDTAVENGTPVDNIRLSGERLEQLQEEIDHGRLLSMLPDRMLPPVEVKNVAIANAFTYNYNGDTLNANNPAIVNSLGLEQLDQQLAQQQAGVPGTAPNPPALRDQPQTGPSPANPPQASPGEAPPPGPTQPTASPQVEGTQVGGAQVGRTPQGANLPPARFDAPPPHLNDNQLAAVEDYLANVREQARRGGEEWQGRNRAYQSYAQSQMVQQRLNSAEPFLETPRHLVSEGVTRPVWIGSKLILARRVLIDGQVVIQGCWLDWPKIKQMLLAEARQILPEVELVPVSPNTNDLLPGRMLATLPAQLVVPEPTTSLSVLDFEIVPDEPAPPTWSAIRVSLVIAWTCLALAAVAVAVLLQGAVTLSERRGAFVAAVTHELRTPLTTFRMYAEMLSAGMVPSGEKQQQYLDTLRVEADRLSHLVENVLAYARLERGKPGRRREAVSLASLLDRVQSRLADRARQAEMELVVEADQAARTCIVHTDPGAVEQILFNLVDNACKYAATADDRRIHLQLAETADGAELCVRDHGRGIAPHEARKLFHPFSKSVHEAASTAPGVGLGLALCRRLARALGGRLELEPGDQGASFLLTLPGK
jgi:signal transduction histidine kinase